MKKLLAFALVGGLVVAFGCSTETGSTKKNTTTGTPATHSGSGTGSKMESPTKMEGKDSKMEGKDSKMEKEATPPKKDGDKKDDKKN